MEVVAPTVGISGLGLVVGWVGPVEVDSCGGWFCGAARGPRVDGRHGKQEKGLGL